MMLRMGATPLVGAFVVGDQTYDDLAMALHLA